MVKPILDYHHPKQEAEEWDAVFWVAISITFAVFLILGIGFVLAVRNLPI